MGVILQILAELILQIVCEALADFGIHQSKRKREINPIAAVIGYLIFGGVLGALSLIVFPESFIENHTFKLLNLVVTPLMLGSLMLVIGKMRKKKGKQTVRIEQFAFGFLFAFGLALVRYSFSK